MKRRLLTIFAFLVSCLCFSYNAVSQTVTTMRFTQFNISHAQSAELDSTGGTIGPYAMELDESYEGDYMQAVNDAREYAQEQGFYVYMRVDHMTSNTITFGIKADTTFYYRTLIITGGNGVGVSVGQSGRHIPGPPAPYDGPTDVSAGNWIQTTTYTDSSATHFVRNISYYDGLGGLSQAISVKGSPSGGNVITPTYYDNMRRADARVYLPYARTDTTAACDVSPFVSQTTYYQSSVYGEGTYTYLENVYEQSALNRVLQSFNVGNAFRTPGSVKHATKTYGANADGEVLLLSVSKSGTLTSGGYYGDHKLYKNTTTDEDGKITVAYMDYEGHTVLSRAYGNGNIFFDTYYVYDNFQRLRWVIPPEGSRTVSSVTVWEIDNAAAARYCYRYQYDGRGNIVERRLPGRDIEYLVYDPAGRVVAVQDGATRSSGKWLMTRYDNFGRQTNVYLSAAITRTELESQFASNPYPAIYSNPGNTLVAEYQYGKPVSAMFSFVPESGYVSSSDRYRDSTGMKTYEKMLDNTTIDGTLVYVERAFYYDYKGRIIQTVEKNLNGGIDRTSFKYNFVGNILARQERVTPTSGGTETVKNTLYTYDQRGRLLTETTTLDGTAQGTASYAYDDLGKLITRTGGNGMVEHTTYNLQGWTTGMSVCTGQTNIYSQQLRYYNPQKGTPPLYTGNISEWSVTQGGNPQSTFGFSYDNLNRLTGTNRYVDAGTTDVTTYTEKNLTYDNNGNILTLGRYGADAGTPEDNFTYTYNGNKLMNLAGRNGGTALSGANYTYDGNGNMTHDGRMNLDVTYDLFGMPQSVQQNGTLKCAYTYLADGTKVMVQDNANSSSSNGYLYLGSMVFRKTGTSYAFESTDFGGGRIINVNCTLSPYYYTTDHLGSVRVIADASGNVTERNDYYPFGKRMTTGNTYPTTSSNRWKYNGKEVQTTGNVNWLDYGAREYDEVIGRWTRPDPMSEKYYGTSGYVFCSDNPENRFDNTGTEDDWVKDSRGNIYWDSNATSQATTKNGETYLGKNGYDLTTYYRPDGTTSSVAFDLPAATINGGYMSEHAKVMSNPVVQAEHEGQDAFLNHPITKALFSIGAYMVGTGILEGLSVFNASANRIVNTGEIQYTKSNLELGQLKHRQYHSGEVGKEFRLPSGKRIDYLDIKNNTIFELKPNNPRAIKQGNKQLETYKNEISEMKRFQNIDWKTYLDTY